MDMEPKFSIPPPLEKASGGGEGKRKQINRGKEVLGKLRSSFAAFAEFVKEFHRSTST